MEKNIFWSSYMSLFHTNWQIPVLRMYDQKDSAGGKSSIDLLRSFFFFPPDILYSLGMSSCNVLSLKFLQLILIYGNDT